MSDKHAIGRLSVHLDGLSATKRQAEQQMDAAIGALSIAHEHLRRAGEHVVKLTEGSAGGGSLDELLRYIEMGREVSAETILVLMQLRPDNSVTSGKDWETIVHSAREGMIAKRLAKWEADALREAAVTELAK